MCPVSRSGVQCVFLFVKVNLRGNPVPMTSGVCLCVNCRYDSYEEYQHERLKREEYRRDYEKREFERAEQRERQRQKAIVSETKAKCLMLWSNICT